MISLDNGTPWKDRVLVALGEYTSAHCNDHLCEVTGEDLRVVLTKIIGPPAHHNAWGSVITAALKRGYLERTDRYQNMKGQRANYRKTPVYRLVSKANAERVGPLD